MIRMNTKKKNKGDIITVLKLNEKNRISIGSIFNADYLYVKTGINNTFTISDVFTQDYVVVKTYRSRRTVILNLNRFISVELTSYLTVEYIDEHTIKARPATEDEVALYVRSPYLKTSIGRNNNIIFPKEIRSFLKSGTGMFSAQIIQKKEKVYLLLKPLFEGDDISSNETIHNGSRDYRPPVFFLKHNNISAGDNLNITTKTISEKKYVVIER